MTGDSKERYGGVSRLFHWGMGALIAWQMLKFFDRIDDGNTGSARRWCPGTWPSVRCCCC